MNIKDMLERGYFPKELPPPFTTKSFADKFSSIETAWNQITESILVPYWKSLTNLSPNYASKCPLTSSSKSDSEERHLSL